MANERESFRDRYRTANQNSRDQVDGFLKSNGGSWFVWVSIGLILAGVIWSLVAN